MNKAVFPEAKRIIIIPLIFVFIFCVGGIILIDAYFNKISIKRYENDLIRLAKSGSQMVELLDDNADIVDFDYFADTYAENSRFRVTLISNTGMVLGDSRLSLREVRTIENHAERPEIKAARETGIGISKRYSNTLSIDLLYVATTYNSLGRQGYFRIALPLTQLQQEQLNQRLFFGGFGFLIMIIAGLLSLTNSRYLIHMIQKGRTQLEKRADKRTQEIEMLQNLGTQLTACNSQSEALEVIKLVTSLLLPHLSGSLALLRPSKNQLEIFTSWNGTDTNLINYSPNECWALRTGKAHLSNPTTGNMTCEHLQAEHNQMLCIPLVAQGETHGVLHFSTNQEKLITSQESKLASAVAEHASLTFANLDLRESLRQQAIRDPLTGLYNRRYLLEAAEHEISRAERRGQQLGILMIDIDYFKKFNDEHGHDVGDIILSEFGLLLRRIIRDEDIACRYGGEEFTVLLPETTPNGAIQVAEKIGKATREHQFISNNRVYGPITLSIGVAIFSENGKTIETLLKEADEALYEAKTGGRNRVVKA